MENFKERAIAWAEAHPEQKVAFETIIDTKRMCLSSGLSYSSDEDDYEVNGRPLTEVIEEWENKMNKMPELKPGMIIEKEYSWGLGMFLVVTDQWAIGIDDDNGFDELFTDCPITRIWAGRVRSLKSLNENPGELLWERKSEEEEKLEGIISDLEQSLADARERLEALK